MLSGKFDNGRIKDLPDRKQQDVSGLWAGKQILFTARLEEMNLLSSQVESVLSLDKAAVCRYFTLPFMLIENKNKVSFLILNYSL